MCRLQPGGRFRPVVGVRRSGAGWPIPAGWGGFVPAIGAGRAGEPSEVTHGGAAVETARRR